MKGSSLSVRQSGILSLMTLGILFVFFHSQPLWAQPYKEASRPVDERVEDLISRLTLEEKVGQMTQINISKINTTGNQRDVKLVPEKLVEMIQKYHVGSFLNGEAVPPQQWFAYSDALQKIAVEKSRLGIPIIYGIDHIHGASYVDNATLFPQAINLGNSFDTTFAYQAGRITSIESADFGHHWNFAPVVDLGRTPQWPRFWETYGQSPLLTSRMGVAYTNGIQGLHPEIAPAHVAATAKHFLGYSDPKSGWDRTPVELSWQTIHEFHRPSFQAVIDAGIKTIMINSGEINGIPVHANPEILIDLLRNQMGFEGVAVTDWADIEKLYNYHKTAENLKEATYQSVMAGIDMSMTPESFFFNDHLIELVKEGRISEERIDQSVRRILKLKFELGLFEYHFPRNDRFDRIGSAEHRAIALHAAEESMVLLRNKNKILPLERSKTKQLLLVGPTAESRRKLSGGWTIAWQGGEEERIPDRVMSIHEALTKQYKNVVLMSTIGEVGSDERKRFEQEAARSTAIVIAAGEEPYTEFIGNISDMSLPQEQLELIKAANATGTPTVLVLVEGRPRLISEVVEETEAILFAGLPSFEGAEAIANILSGDVNPSGKLSFAYPAFPNHFVPFNHKKTATYFFDPNQANFIQQKEKSTALYDFGHGLSYTSFAYSELKLSSKTLDKNRQITATVQVTNNGKRAGKEAVLWFLTDEVARISRPVKMLKHFEKVELKAGESKTLTFVIRPEESLTYPGFDGKPIYEPGVFTLRVGGRSEEFILK